MPPDGLTLLWTRAAADQPRVGVKLENQSACGNAEATCDRHYFPHREAIALVIDGHGRPLEALPVADPLERRHPLQLHGRRPSPFARLLRVVLPTRGQEEARQDQQVERMGLHQP